MLQYISFYYNINIATFVGFQIAVYAYVVLRILLHTQAQVARVNAKRASCYVIRLWFGMYMCLHMTILTSGNSLKHILKMAAHCNVDTS